MDEQVTLALDEINALARALHGDDAAATVYTFKSLAEHVDEVKGLLAKGDPHWKAETLDIIIHALTLLRRGGAGAAEVEQLMAKRLAKFQEKISIAVKKDKG